MTQLDTDPLHPLRIESDYHSASYTSKNLDTWMYTNSTELTLFYDYKRLGKLRANKIIVDGDFSGNRFRNKTEILFTEIAWIRLKMN